MTAERALTTKATEQIDNGMLGGTIEQDGVAWQCEYIPMDASFWVRDQRRIRKVAVAEDLAPMGSSALLNIRAELGNVSEQVLQTSVLGIQIRDKLGMSLFDWRGKALDFLISRPEESSRVLHASLRLEPKTLNSLQLNGPNKIHVVLEDREGGILDHVMGEIRVRSVKEISTLALADRPQLHVHFVDLTWSGTTQTI